MAGVRPGYDNKGYGDRRSQANYGGPRRDARKDGRDAVDMKPHIQLDADTYVDTAEKVIEGLKKGGGLLSTSKIRNLLSMISSLYDEVRRERSDKLSKKDQEQIQYIRLHFAYEAGRDSKVKEFVNAADIIAHIKDIGDNKEHFLLFCKYMEALVAYHRYHGGKE